MSRLQVFRKRAAALALVWMFQSGAWGAAGVQVVQKEMTVVSFFVTGVAESDGAAIVKIWASIGGVKAGEMEGVPNEAVADFFILVTGAEGGDWPLIVTAQDAEGNTFSSEAVPLHITSRATAQMVAPSTDVTIRFGQEVTLRAEPLLDFGRVSSMAFVGTSENLVDDAQPYEVVWKPEWPAVYEIRAIPTISLMYGVAASEPLTVTVLPEGIPLVSREAGNLGTLEGGRLLLVETISRGPVTYQWLRNGDPIPGATDSTYFMAGPGPSDDGFYCVLIDNYAGRAVSSVHEVEARTGGGLVHFSNQTDGIDAPIQAAPQAGLPRQIHAELWVGPEIHRMRPVTARIPVVDGYFDAGVVPLPNIAPGEKAFVQVFATDSSPVLEIPRTGRSEILEITAGDTEPALLAGLEAFEISRVLEAGAWWELSAPRWIKAGGGADLKLEITYTDPDAKPILPFQWSKNGRDIPGATNEVLEIRHASRSDAGYYSVRADGWGREAGAAVGVEDSARLQVTEDGALELRGAVSGYYAVETSTDLKLWLPWTRLEAGAEVVRVELPARAGNVFYRAVLEP